MSGRGWGIGLVVIGLVVVGISLLADMLGYGSQPGTVGWKQLLSGALGVAITISGLVLTVRGRREKKAGQAPLMPDSHPHSIRQGGQLAPVAIDAGSSYGQPGESPAMTGAAAGRRASESRAYDSASLRVPFIHELIELGRYRFLLWNLVLRDLKVRYKRSVLGLLWAMVNPLLTMAVLLVVFTRLFRFDVEHYPIYILSGLLLWTLLARGTTVAMRSVIDNAGIRNKIYVPASVFVAAAIGSAFVNLLFALVPLLALAILTGVPPSLAWFYLPVPILQTTLLAFGVGVLIAALSVFFADMLDIYDVLLQAFFYLTPIIYPVSILPEQLVKLERFNLVFSFIDDFRTSLLLGRLPDLGGVLLTTAAALAVTAVGWTLFTRLLDQFAYRA